MDKSGISRLTIIVTVVIIGIILLSIGAFLIYKNDSNSSSQISGTTNLPLGQEQKTVLPSMANLPKTKSKLTTPPPQPTYPPDAPVLDQARKALRDGVSPEKAVILAKSLPESPEQADAAFLLLEYAAEKGHSEAALIVARYYDPTDDMPSGTIHKNPETAYDWYRTALEAGREDARAPQARLYRWVEKRAQEGSYEADQLLTNWR